MSIAMLLERTPMSLDTATAERLSQRIEELIVILKRILEDLQEVSQSLKLLQPARTPTPTVPAPTPMGRSPTIPNVKALFPKELEDMLAFEEKEKFIVIRPRQFLGSENFAKIASIVRGAGGEYISAGKESHFRISKEAK